MFGNFPFGNSFFGQPDATTTETETPPQEHIVFYASYYGHEQKPVLKPKKKKLRIAADVVLRGATAAASGGRFRVSTGSCVSLCGAEARIVGGAWAVESTIISRSENW